MVESLHPVPSAAALATALDPRVLRVARAVRDANGRALLVGGFVRDALLGRPSKDVDVEVFGLDLPALTELLGRIGSVKEVGRSFGVLRLRSLDVDFSLPRRDSKIGRGHKGILAEVDPGLDLATAARRRDLTVNAISLDPLTAELLDPLGGVEDLRQGVLRACDPSSFGEDPLRALRVAQFVARFDLQPDERLLWLCHEQDLSELSGERILEEMRKLLLKGRQPSRGLRLLERTTLLRHFRELLALVGVPQDVAWHPEGDVWVHTCMVVDEAAALRLADHDSIEAPPPHEVDEDQALMFAALCHDLGKPRTTLVDRSHVRSPGHDVVGAELAGSLLHRLRASKELITRVKTLTRHHLAPALLYQQESTDRAYRRLARRLAHGQVSIPLMERLARADHFGRDTIEARERRFPAGDHFLARMAALSLLERAPVDVVRGRHLLARGLRPGKDFSGILRLCREIQDETGWTSPDDILDRALENRR